MTGGGRVVTVKSPDVLARVRVMRSMGMTLETIGAEFGVRKETVSSWLRDPDSSHYTALKAAWRGASVERCEEIERLWREGQSIATIARRLNSTPGTIGSTVSRMRSHGWDVPHRYPQSRIKAMRETRWPDRWPA